MPRGSRVAPAGYPLHVLNRAAGRIRPLRSAADFEAFEKLIVQAHARCPIPIFSYCLMGNHWHFVVRPDDDGQVTAFFKWLTHTHAMRWRTAKRTVGYGPLYQGRFKSFLIEEDQHLLTVCRYVERNALTAGLVERAEDWRWGSLHSRRNPGEGVGAILSPWPIDRPTNWENLVNQPMTEKEINGVRTSMARNRPLGTAGWVEATSRKLGLGHTLRPEGRPRKERRGEN